MSFKKFKIKKSIQEPWDFKITSLQERYITAKKKNYLFWVLLWLLGVFFIWIFAFFTLSKLDNFKLDLSFFNMLNIWWLSSIDPDREKINILLTWMWWWAHEWAELTDTIILASINIKKKTVSMLSIPRDLYVSYPSWWAWRINELYMKWKKAFSESKAMTYLEEKVEEITWEKSDYYINIDFAWFTKFVDLLGWIEVDVPEDLIDTQYPDNNRWYETFKVKKWLQTLNGTTSLKYARSRHSTSDFDRSLRQQLVIKAIKTKLLDLNYITSPSKLKALYYSVSSNIRTDLSLKEMLSFALLAKDVGNNIFSFNLNNSCEWWINTCTTWGFLYTPSRDLFNWASVILPEDATPSNISNYTSINKFANIVINYPEMLLENYEINIVNSTKVGWLANKFASMLKKYWFNIPEKDSIKSTKDKFEKTKVFYKWNEELKDWVNSQSKTLEALTQFIFADQEPHKILEYTDNLWAKIEIILGDDYKLFLNQNN